MSLIKKTGPGIKPQNVNKHTKNLISKTKTETKKGSELSTVKLEKIINVNKAFSLRLKHISKSQVSNNSSQKCVKKKRISLNLKEAKRLDKKIDRNFTEKLAQKPKSLRNKVDTISNNAPLKRRAAKEEYKENVRIPSKQRIYEQKHGCKTVNTINQITKTEVFKNDFQKNVNLRDKNFNNTLYLKVINELMLAKHQMTNVEPSAKKESPLKQDTESTLAKTIKSCKNDLFNKSLANSVVIDIIEKVCLPEIGSLKKGISDLENYVKNIQTKHKV